MPEAAARARQIAGSTWVLGIAVAFLAWPMHGVVPGTDIDSSWQLSLQMALDRGVDFGTEYVLNGGPLEFVLHPMVMYSGPAAVGAIYLLATQIALGLTMVWLLRRNLPLLLAVPLAYVLLALDADQFVPAPEPLLVLAFVWCMVSLGKDPPSFIVPLVVVGGAVVSATGLLIQFSEGFLVLFMCSVAVFFLSREDRRVIPAFGAAFLVALAVMWFAAGQSAGNFDDYLRTAFEIVSQWSTALPYDEPVVGWARIFAAAAIAASLAAVYLGTLGWDPMRRGAAALLVAALDFSAWKHGFVIETGSYAALFTTLLLLPWLVFRWEGPTLAVALGAIAALVVLFYPVSGKDHSELTRPIARVESAADQLEALLLPGPRERIREEARRQFKETYDIDPETLGLLRGKSVLMYPWETAPVWAYGLDWYPQPVFPYLGYTPALDRLSARAIESPSGPQAILRHRPCGAVGKPPFIGCEAWVAAGPTFLPHQLPEMTIAMLCNFAPVRTTERFQVLTRVDDRCGEPHFLYSHQIDDEHSRIPRSVGSKEAVFARVHGLEPSGLERLRTFLYRAVERMEIFDGLYGYRVVPGTMTDGVILRVPKWLNFALPFPVTPNATSIGFETKSAFLSSGGEYRIDYYALPIRSVPARDGE